MDMLEYKFLQENLNLFNKNIKRIEMALEKLKQQRYILNLNDGQLLKGLNSREIPIDDSDYHYVKVIDEFRNYVFQVSYGAGMAEGTVKNIDKFIECLQRCERPLHRKLLRKNTNFKPEDIVCSDK